MRHRKLVLLSAILIASATLPLPAISEQETSVPENPAVQRGSINRDASALSPPATMTTEGKDTFTETKPRLVVALSGGALKAVAQIGVLRSLENTTSRLMASSVLAWVPPLVLFTVPEFPSTRLRRCF